MTTVDDVRAALTVCGTCANCKIMLWSDGLRDENKKKLNRIKTVDYTKYYTIRCNWTKNNLIEPQALEKCEGFREIKI